MRNILFKVGGILKFSFPEARYPQHNNAIMENRGCRHKFYSKEHRSNTVRTYKTWILKRVQGKKGRFYVCK